MAQKRKNTAKKQKLTGKPIQPLSKTISTRRGILKVVSWNIENRKNTTGSKFEDNNFLAKIIENDIICLQETKGPVYLEGHRSFNNNRENSTSGGVAILVKNELSKGVSLLKTPDTHTNDIIAVKLDKNFFNTANNIVIATFYVSPSHSSYFINHPSSPYPTICNELGKLSNYG